MGRESRGVPTERREHGPCHRCGWVTDVTRVRRRSVCRSAVDRHFTRLCDECLEDLRRGRTRTMALLEAARAGGKTAHRSEVA
jgi:hypothetical protein